jgi:hypothetical protein
MLCSQAPPPAVRYAVGHHLTPGENRCGLTRADMPFPLTPAGPCTRPHPSCDFNVPSYLLAVSAAGQGSTDSPLVTYVMLVL